MNLCLLSDAWIPAVRHGDAVTIRPDQIAEPGMEALAWSRPDFRLACLELLIGLVSMADPPSDDDDWRARLDQPDAGRLRRALAPFAPHFFLAGDGPRFLQDQEPFEQTDKQTDIRGVDTLYMDSAGQKTVEDNADLMVKRDRFTSLSLAEAAMAVYTLQAFAPEGGMGLLTSMRGGGPMTTLVRPLDRECEQYPLWRLVFANVLPGRPLPPEDAGKALPWLRPTRTSEGGRVVTSKDTHTLEAFFGMPRRLRLVFEENRVTGVVQKPRGIKYEAWHHPLTPYRRTGESSAKWSARRPKPGRIQYRGWLGISMESARDDKGLQRLARTVQQCRNRVQSPEFEILAGGWTMSQAKPLSFTLDQYPGYARLDEEHEHRIHQLVEAADVASGALRKALYATHRKTKLRKTIHCQTEAVIEAFFADTEEEFRISIREVSDGADSAVEEKWHKVLKGRALAMFSEWTLEGLAEQDIGEVERRLEAKRALHAALTRRVRQAMDLPWPAKQEERE